MRESDVSSQAGYTLLELLLYVAIVGSLLTSVTYFFGVAVDARVKNQTISEVNEQGTAAMDYLTQTIRNATAISAPAAAASASALTVTVPTGSLSPTIFNLSGTSALQVQEGSGGQIPLTSNDVTISGLTFTNLTKSGTSGTVQVKFTVSRVNPSSRNEYDYQKTFTSSAEIGW
ncbi:MAG TPA: type II secretion system protein [Candidatus Saccharimonadales bacterium]|nr:type II secretion system protein [Candidatus Saccharimonadales bacterium]